MEQVTARKPRTMHVPEADAMSLAQAALDVSNKALAATSGLDAKLDQIIGMLGTEQEDGKGGYTSTGLLGRVRRVEAVSLALVRKYQGWFQIALGFGVSSAFFIGVIWFLTKGKIATIFGL